MNDVSDLDTRLASARQVRDELADLLKKKVSSLKEERRQWLEEFDQQIMSLEGELRHLGHHVASNGPNEAGLKAYAHLMDFQGVWQRGADIMRAIGVPSAHPCVVLRPYLDDHRVEKRGEGKGTQYRVPEE